LPFNRGLWAARVTSLHRGHITDHTIREAKTAYKALEEGEDLVVNHRDFDMYICAPCVFLRLRKSAYPMKEHLSKLLWSSTRGWGHANCNRREKENG
jgi:hypothetical protein